MLPNRNKARIDSIFLVIAIVLPPFPGVTHRLWEVTTTNRVPTPKTKVKITSMELLTC
jgi:hypothetical protein